MTRNVCFDARMWNHPGIGRYIRELVSAILAKPRDFNFALLGDEKIKTCLPPEAHGRFEFLSASSGIYSLKEQFEIPKKARWSDLLHVPHFNIPVFFKKKLVVTVHDLIYLHQSGVSKYPGAGFYARMLFRAIRRHASAILVVSEYTKQDLLNYDPQISPDRVFVTHEAPSKIFKKIHEESDLHNARAKYRLETPFILFVGSLKTHKNVETLIQAVKTLKETKRIRHELVLVGRLDVSNKPLLEMIGDNASFVRYLGELPDAELPVLYNLAEVFVLPSHWEGFGLPILEAMACGTPVIASNRTSLPEIAGGAALLFESTQVDALSGLIYNVLTDAELQTQMSEDGLRQAARFSWEMTAEETMQIYKRVLS